MKAFNPKFTITNRQTSENSRAELHKHGAFGFLVKRQHSKIR